MGKNKYIFKRVCNLAILITLLLSVLGNATCANVLDSSEGFSDEVYLSKEAVLVPGQLNEWEIDLVLEIEQQTPSEEIVDNFIFPIQNLKLNDTIVKGFDIQGIPWAERGNASGIEVIDNNIIWEVDENNFELDVVSGNYIVHIKYRIKANLEIINEMKKRPDNSVEISENSSIKYDYLHNDLMNHYIKHFPKPKVTPTIIEVESRLFNMYGEEMSLVDYENDDRVFMYMIFCTELLKEGNLYPTKYYDYFIPTTSETITLLEYDILHDNMDRFDISYYLSNNTLSGLNIYYGTFDLIENSGINKVEIHNTEKMFYSDSFSLTKVVSDQNGNNIAEPNEVLKYTISIKNGRNIIRKMNIRDSLGGIMEHITPNDDFVLKINNVAVPLLTLSDLISETGINLYLDCYDNVLIEYSATVKRDILISEIENYVKANDKTASTRILTGREELISSKEVYDEDGDGVASYNELLTYKLITTNVGRVDAHDVFVKDELLDIINKVGFCDQYVTLINDNIISRYEITELQNGFYIDVKSGKTATVVFDVYLETHIDTNEVKQLYNKATIDNEVVEVTIRTGSPKLSSKIEVFDETNDGIASPGEKITYTITTKNVGLVGAQNVLIKDDLLPLLDHVDTSGQVVTLTNDDEVTTHTIAELQNGFYIDVKSGKTATVVFDVYLETHIDTNEVKQLYNKATIDNEVVEVTIRTGSPKLSSKIEVFDETNDGIASPGEKITYTITTKNVGLVGAQNVLIKDDLLPLLDHVDTSGQVVTLTNDDEVTTHTIAELQNGFLVNVVSGKTVTVDFDVYVKANLNVEEVTILHNIASIGNEELEANILTGKTDYKQEEDTSNNNDNGENDNNIKKKLNKTGLYTYSLYVGYYLIISGIVLFIKKKKNQ